MKTSKRGVTLVELLVATAILVTIAAVGIAVFNRLIEQTALDSSVQQVLSIFEEARSRTLASENDQQFGVHLATSSVTLFVGSTYNASASTNKVTTLVRRVSISDISMTGGATEVVFARLTGKASVTGTITLTLISDTSQTHTLTINSTGLVER